MIAEKNQAVEDLQNVEVNTNRQKRQSFDLKNCRQLLLMFTGNTRELSKWWRDSRTMRNN